MRLVSTGVVGLLLVAASMGCGGSEGLATPGAHLILVSLDTLRADRLGLYGYDRDTSPRLDALLAGGFVFERAYTHSPNTIVSHASLLTSLHPVAHGVRPDAPLGDSLTTLAEALSAAGYQTAAFTAHGDWLNREKGFAQGFEHFDAAYRDADALHRALFAWLEAGRDGERPLFLFLHYYDVHSDWGRLPYESPPAFRPGVAPSVGGFSGCRDGVCASELLLRVREGTASLSAAEVAWVSDLYDGGVRFMDDRMGRLADRLGEDGLLDDAWLAVTSDHGEEFLEHGKALHSQPYEHTARVPLLLRPPASARPAAGPVRIGDAVAHVDVMPTLLALVGLAPATGIQGRSLLPLLEGRSLPEVAVFFNGYQQPDHVAVRSGEFVLLTRDAEVELYDRRADPVQQRDLATARPEVVERLRGQVRAFRRAQEARAAARAGDAAPLAPDAAERERLRRLGYLD